MFIKSVIGFGLLIALISAAFQSTYRITSVPEKVHEGEMLTFILSTNGLSDFTSYIPPEYEILSYHSTSGECNWRTSTFYCYGLSELNTVEVHTKALGGYCVDTWSIAKLFSSEAPVMTYASLCEEDYFPIWTDE